jgi:sugar phosphate isomerase/epimerase
MRIQIGAQIYTIRDELKSAENVLPAFEFLAKCGCQVVELAGMPEISAPEIAKISADTGVAVCSTHSPYERIAKDLDRLADEHLTMGADFIGLGSMPSVFNRRTESGIKEFAEFLNSTAEKLKSHNLSIVYHNHKFEFKQRFGGKRMMDILLDLTMPEVTFCLDIYWAKAGGANIFDYIDKMDDRLAILHLKDYKPTFLGLGNTMATPGEGILDIKHILQKSEAAGTRFAVVEVDKTSDPRGAIERGVKFINEIY